MGERIEAIGNRLGINQATIKTKLHRCRKRLKAVFEERGTGMNKKSILAIYVRNWKRNFIKNWRLQI